MAIKTLIFDLGGVLVSFNHDQMFSQVGEVVGASPEEVYELLVEERVALQFERGLLSNEEIYTLFKDLGKKPFEKDHLFQAASSIFSPRKEMFSLVKRLKEKGYQLMILSNTVSPHIDYISNSYTILPLFDHLIFSFELGFAKPEKEIFLHTLKKANHSPSECFFIDDLIQNVHAAEKLGIKSHHFTSLPSLMDDLMGHGIL